MSVFRFKEFSVKQESSAMKVGTDAMLLGTVVNTYHDKRILDIGTGTGVIALIMAQRYSKSEISAIEVDEASAFEAMENFQNSPWSDRLSVIHADFLEHSFDQKFDLIVSNPPYFQTRLENNDPRKSQARHESALPMKAMLKKVSQMLTKFGYFWVIVPFEVRGIWTETAEEFGLQCVERRDIFGKRGGSAKRIILGFASSELEFDPQDLLYTSLNQICIRNEEGKYTRQYVELTEAFHFNKLN